MMPDPAAATDVLSRPLHVTVWKSMFPREAGGGLTTMRTLAERIKVKHAPSKEQLWWLKLARFGDVRNDKGYLRHNDNLIECEGLEADYDGGKISFEEAVDIAEKVGLACIIYTSPSNKPDFPKWRILAPFSAPMDPVQRDHLMGRLNGLFRGVFDSISWTLSQSYYYGFVDGNADNHRVELIEGDPIDELYHLDAGWMAKPLRSVKFNDAEAHDSAYRRHAHETELDIDQVYAAIESGENFHGALLSLAAHLFGKDHKREDVHAELIRVMNDVPVEHRDRRWKNRSSPRHLNDLLNWLSARENKKLFKRLREVEDRQEDARTTPEPDEAPADADNDAEPRESDEGRADDPAPPKDEKPKKNTATNALTLRRALRRKGMSGLVAYDEFALRPMLMKPIPDPDHQTNQPFEPRPWQDADDIQFAMWFQGIGYLKATKTLANDVMQILCQEDRFHPVRDYLAGLKWDRTERISALLTKGFGAIHGDAEQAQYLKSVSRAWLISAVARVTVPGAKVDTMPILEGPQGVLKSSGVRALCPVPAWFSDTMPNDLGNKDARQHLPGNWIVEMSEISQLRKSEVENLKSFLSTQTDKYRPSYGRAEVERHRQCVFVGTTNEDAYLSDATGNRRFWPVRVGRIDLAWIAANRDQLWAEAAAAYRSGEKWWLEGAAADYAVQAQAERAIEDSWDGPISDWLSIHSGPVTVGQILRECFFLDMSMHGKVEQMRVSTCLKRGGYSRKYIRILGAAKWAWCPP